MEGLKRTAICTTLAVFLMVIISGISLAENEVSPEFDQSAVTGSFTGMERDDNGSQSGPNGSTSEAETGQASDQESGQERKGATEIQQHSSGYLGQFGNFDLQDGIVDGRYIKFGFDAGVITDMVWSEDDILLFERIDISGIETDLDVSVTGAIFMAEGEEVSVMVHNNPTGHVRINYMDGPEASVVLIVGDDMTITESDKGNVTFEGPSGTSRLWTVNATISVAGSSITVTMEGNSHLMFMIHPETYRSRTEAAINEGLSRGKVDTRTVIERNGTGQDFPFEGKVKTSVEEVIPGESAKVQVESQEHSGKVISLRFESGTISRDRIKVCLDGEVIEEASDPGMVINASGGLAMYHGETLEDGSQEYLVYVPEFSVHEVSFAPENEIGEEVPFLGIAILLGAVLLVLIVSAVIVKKRS